MSKRKNQDDPGFVTLDEFDAVDAQYNILFGQRSNGKTFCVLERILQKWHEKHEQGAILRRYQYDFKLERAKQMWDGHVQQGLVRFYTDGQWEGVEQRGRGFYFTKYDEELCKTIRASEPFCYALSLHDWQHDKGNSFPGVTTVLFDEFISNTGYLPDEFNIFSNVISTIVRNRDNLKVYLCGNNINLFCPYYEEMGLTGIRKMKQGEFFVYEYGDSGLKTAIKYTENLKKQPSSKFFAFNNPKLKMITDGAWALDIYPHAPCKWERKDVVFDFFVIFHEYTLHGEIVQDPDVRGGVFVFIHNKTTPIPEKGNFLVYDLNPSTKPNFERFLNRPRTDAGKKIRLLIDTGKVFFSTNEIGNIFDDFMRESVKLSI